MVESSTFGSEFLALRFGIELVKDIHFKLHMMSIPLDYRPKTLWLDNETVAKTS